MGSPSPLLLVYDAESAPCRALVDWIRKRDRACLIIAFPYQNAELVRLAPELAGMAFLGEIHGLDTRTRQATQGAALLPQLFERLPTWQWLAPLLAIAPLRALTYSALRRLR